MGKNIIILNGSPRKAGNTTALTAEFVRGAEESGSTVTEFFLDGMNINGCKGCFGGHSSQRYRHAEGRRVRYCHGNEQRRNESDAAP